jgi:hypothetical protein
VPWHHALRVQSQQSPSEKIPVAGVGLIIVEDHRVVADQTAGESERGARSGL